MNCNSDFDQNTASLAMIHLADKIRKQLDKGNFSYGIFVDFQKALNTIDHDILIQN